MVIGSREEGIDGREVDALDVERSSEPSPLYD